MNRTLRGHGMPCPYEEASELRGLLLIAGQGVNMVDVDGNAFGGVDDHRDGADAELQLGVVELHAAHIDAADAVGEGQLPVRIDAELVDGAIFGAHHRIDTDELAVLGELYAFDGYSYENITAEPVDEQYRIAGSDIIFEHTNSAAKEAMVSG